MGLVIFPVPEAFPADKAKAEGKREVTNGISGRTAARSNDLEARKGLAMPRMREREAMIDPRAGRAAILGVPLDNLSMAETVARIDSLIDKGGFHQIATANVNFLMNSIRDEELMDILHRCDLVLPDGMPLVWASRLMGTAAKERIAGADLILRLVELSQQKKRRLFLLGATEERSAAAAAWIKKAYPGAQLAGRYAPPFGPIEEMNNDDILDRIEEAKVDILLVALGNPKQEKWLALNRTRLHVPVCIGVGAGIDFLSGYYPRAPLWMQRNCLEWLHRLCIEPRRLGPRYARNAVGVGVHLMMQVAADALQSRVPSVNQLEVTHEDRALVIQIGGRLTGSLVKDLREAVRRSLGADCALIVDLSLVTNVGADGLAILLDLSSKLRERRQEVWLTGLRPRIQRLFRTAFLNQRLFRFAPKAVDAVRRIDSLAAKSEPEPLRPFITGKASG